MMVLERKHGSKLICFQTNHLDLDACVWLEEELKTYKRILVVVSHSQDFLNGVSTHTIHLLDKKLAYYGVSSRSVNHIGLESSRWSVVY